LPDVEFAKYQPVCHFLDERLFSSFLEKLTRNTLVAPLRADEKLRNRYFPGFRVSESTPTAQQILTAYRTEIVQRGNSVLANLLCKHWLFRSSALLRSALESIGLSPKDVTLVDSWIKEAQSRLGPETSQKCLRDIVLATATGFSADEILIFVSIMCDGHDQQALREFVDRELRMNGRLSTDPHSSKKELEQELLNGRLTLQNLDTSRAQLLLTLEAETVAAQKTLDSSFLGYNESVAEGLQIQTEVEAIAVEMEALKKRLASGQQLLDDNTRRTEKLNKAVAQHREQTIILAKDQMSRQRAADDLYNKQAQLVTRIEADLKLVENRIREEAVRQETIQAPLQRAGGQETVMTPPPFGIAQRASDRLGNNAICYQGLQRLFRNTVVGFLRHRLPRIFPTDHAQRMKKLFGEHWEKAAQNAAQSREIGGTTTTVRDEYDLLGTNHFFEIFDTFYDKLFSTEAGQPAGLPRPVKSKVLGNLKTIKDGRDPLSHPVEEDISFEEGHHLLIEAKQILAWLGYDAQAAELSTLATQLNGGEVEPPSIVRRLPSEDSIYQEFVGRGTVLTDLAACFANPDNRRCLLAGDGGKGKSAVAYRFAQNLSSSPGRFQLIIWLSAKRRKFQDGSTSNIELPDFTTAEEAVDRLLNEYGATATDLSKTPEEKRRLLMDFMDTLPAFVIADDIDTVLDDYQVVSLFTHDIPHTQSAVLLTSRRDIPGVRSFIIKEFDQAEANQFVRSRIKLYDLDAALFVPSILSEIAKATDGSPLYMDDLLRLTKVVNIKTAIKMWQEKKGDEARKYALQRELEQLTVDAKRVLIAAAITDDPISFAELENLLRLPEERLYSTLNELQTLFLFPKPRIVEGEQRFQINLNTKKLVRLVESSSDMYARIERASKALAGKLPDAGKGIISSLIRQAYLRLNAGQYSEAEAILQDAIGKYPNATDLHGFLGFTYRRAGRIADARNQFEVASKFKDSKREMFLQWIKMEISDKEWSKAIAVAEKGLKHHPTFYELVENKVYAQRQAGFDFHRGLHREKAEKLWIDAVEEVKRKIKVPEELESGARQQNASMFCSIVICLDMLGRFRERDLWLDRWEKEHPDDPQVARQKEYLRQKRGSFNVATSLG